MSTTQKVAVTTGASQGIGAKLVKAYREGGYRVVATARSIRTSDDPDILAAAGDIAAPETAPRDWRRRGQLRPHRYADQ